MSRVIRVDDDVVAWLASQAQPFVDTPNSVLRRVAGLPSDVHVIDTVRGPVRPKSKLTADQVVEIRQRHAAGGISMAKLAKEYGVGTSNICLIIRRETWRNI